MGAQRRVRGAKPDELSGFAANLFTHQLDVGEERLDERVEFCPGRRELKRAPIEELRSEVFLQLQNLHAHGGLLNAVGNVAHSLADAFVAGDVIEQLQMVNVHGLTEWMALSFFIN